MAKFNKGILGPISGKLGPIIGSSWKGIPYLKTVAKNPIKRVPTLAQQAHYRKFNFLTKWLRPLHPFLTRGFRNLAAHNTEINVAFSYNFKVILTGADDSLQMDYQNVRISRGELKGIHQPTMILINDDRLKVTWNNIEPCGEYNDQLMLVVYNDELGISDGFTGGVKRSAKTCTVKLDQKLVGKPFHVFVGLVSLNGRKISESQYLGMIAPI
jgi:hypothetical protein